jgi:hypothetical protein
MEINLDVMVAHDSTEECIACRAQDLVMHTLVPAVAAWEVAAELPRFSVALHGAAGLLANMLEEGIPREKVEGALSELLDRIEQQIAEDEMMGGPPQGSA